MARSKREIPHYYLFETVDMTDALAWLKAANDKRAVTDRLLLAVLYARAVALAAADHPALNGTYVDGHAPSERVNLGFATAMRGGGLIAPCIFDADKKDVDALMRDIADIVRRVRAGGLRGSEMTSGTITLTSLGDTGVEALVPVIQPPQVAIVGVGSIVPRPWVVDGKVEVRSVASISVAADHRVSDGHAGALFLRDVAMRLEHPEEP